MPKCNKMNDKDWETDILKDAAIFAGIMVFCLVMGALLGFITAYGMYYGN